MPKAKKKNEKKNTDAAGKKKQTGVKKKTGTVSGKAGAAAQKTAAKAKKTAAKAKKTAAKTKKAGFGAKDPVAAAKPGKRQSTTTEKSGAGRPDNAPDFIVGIGSSAGGLEALKEFFDHMPADSGLAFVLVPHLDPTAKSILHEILQAHTDMPVTQAQDDTPVTANSVYVIPPNRMLGIIHGHLLLMETEKERGMRHHIDYFFRSLAEDYGDSAIGLIFSGTGSEGVLGAQAIKAEGGLVIAQDPKSARFDTMPQAVINANQADWILPPLEMPAKLMSYSRNKYRQKQRPEGQFDDEGLKKLFLLIRSRTGHDFSFYKSSTIRRRIARRMDINQIAEVDSYITYVQKHPAEVELLFRELLIRVTNFFRNPAAFRVLKEKVLPNIVEEVNQEEPIRVWVPACSSGEEVYSVAIILDEYMHDSGAYLQFQIFATDIDEEAVDKARRGLYPKSIGVDVSSERLKRYFTLKGSGYEINKRIRENIVFAVHNIIKDPPLSRMDLICCRNLLIYFNSSLQQKIMNIFHYAMNPGGFLFLGSSETIGSNVDLFRVMDSRWKIFKVVGKSSYRRGLHLSRAHDQAMGTKQDVVDITERRQPSQDDLIRSMLLESYTPACTIIKESGSILYFFGRTGKYLEPAQGQAKLNIFEMARPGLKSPLMECIKKVRLGQQEAFCPEVRVRSNGGTATCNLRVRRIKEPGQLAGLLLLVFEEVPAAAKEPGRKKGAKGGVKSSGRVAELENEVKNVREHLQTTIEQLETSNEELQSTNEELQSTNEELETSREELQSVNEELITVNAEAQEKIEKLAQARNEMANLLTATEIATIFLDQEMRIKNFTPDASRIFKLIPTDIGRPLSDITNILNYDRLLEDLLRVLDTLIPVEKQVLTADGFWYLMKILPYRTENNVIEGLVMTFVDVSKQKHAEVLLNESEERRTSILDQSGEGFILIDFESGSITDSNEEFQQMTGRHAWELKKMKIWDLVPESGKKKAREKYLKESLMSLEKDRREKLLGSDGEAREFTITTRMITIGERKYLQCFLRPA